MAATKSSGMGVLDIIYHSILYISYRSFGSFDSRWYRTF